MAKKGDDMAEARISEALDKQKKLIEEVGSEESVEKLLSREEENGWDLDFDPVFEQSPPPVPKVRLVRRATLNDTISAERLARKSWDIGEDEDVSPHQLAVAKLAILCKFNDELWDVHKIANLSADFLSHVCIKWVKFIS